MSSSANRTEQEVKEKKVYHGISIEDLKEEIRSVVKEEMEKVIKDLKKDIEYLKDEITILKRRNNYGEALVAYMATHNGSLESFYPTVTFTTDNILPDEDEEIPAYRR